MPLPPDEPNEEEELEELPGDGATPFSLPDDPKVDIGDSEAPIKRQLLGSTHPATDGDLDEQELYDEGLSGAAEASEPNANDAVVAYHPRHEE